MDTASFSSSVSKKKSSYCDRWVVVVIVVVGVVQKHYSKSTLGIKIKLGILAHHDKVQLQDMMHNSDSCSFGVMPLVNL